VKYVVDASVAVTRLLGEANAEVAERLFFNARLGVDELIAPEFFVAECGHVIVPLSYSLFRVLLASRVNFKDPE
jgi:hypothetical protein